MRRLLVERIGRRGAALLFFAWVDAVICFGIVNVPRPLNPTYAWMAGIMPLWAWAACWALVAAICLVSAFIEADDPAFVAAIAIKVGWGLLSLFGWLAGADPRGYVSAVFWLSFAGMVYLIAGGIPASVRRVRPKP